MHWIREVFGEIRRGENVDLYVTVAAAIAVTLLGVSGVNAGQWRDSLTVALLALFAVALLGNRRRLDTLLHTASPFVTTFPQDYPDRISQSSHVWIVGVNLSVMLPPIYDNIRQQLARRGSVRALLVQPGSDAVKVAALSNIPPMEAESNDAAIRQSIVQLRALAAEGGGSLEIRTVEHVLPFGAVMIDPETPEGCLYVRHYPYRSAVKQLVLTPRSGEWWLFYRQQIESLWRHGVAA
jgi:hypothetical protein